jgi:hypothetical protein
MKAITYNELLEKTKEDHTYLTHNRSKFKRKFNYMLEPMTIAYDENNDVCVDKINRCPLLKAVVLNLLNLWSTEDHLQLPKDEHLISFIQSTNYDITKFSDRRKIALIWNYMITCLQEVYNFNDLKQYSYFYDKTNSRDNMKKYWIRLNKSYAKLIIRSYDINNDCITGGRAFKKIEDTCKKYGINLESFANNNYEYCSWFQQTQMPSIGPHLFNGFKNKVLEHCYHIDINSAYAYNLIKQYPELKPVFDDLYQQKLKAKLQHTNKENTTKLSIDAGIGYMQSAYCDYKYVKLAYYAIKGTIMQVNDMVDLLKSKNVKVIATNVDGIWFQYNGNIDDLQLDLSDTEFGKFKLDHINCKLRYLNDGNYEYIENGVNNCVFRGVPKSVSNWITFDSIKSLKDLSDYTVVFELTKDGLKTKIGEKAKQYYQQLEEFLSERLSILKEM